MLRLSLLLGGAIAARGLLVAVTRRSRSTSLRASAADADVLGPLPPTLAASPRWWGGAPVLSALQFLHPHSDFAHRYWTEILESGDVVVDATAGNGHDTSVLALALGARGGGTLYVCDVQTLALERSRVRVREALEAAGWSVAEGEGSAREVQTGASLELQWVLGSHDDLLASLAEASVRLVVFNLGYLPGGDKVRRRHQLSPSSPSIDVTASTPADAGLHAPPQALVTEAPTTVRALEHAERAVGGGGCVSVTIYPGHEARQRISSVSAAKSVHGR